MENSSSERARIIAALGFTLGVFACGGGDPDRGLASSAPGITAAGGSGGQADGGDGDDDDDDSGGGDDGDDGGEKFDVAPGGEDDGIPCAEG
ncbi:MAG: hypothetical protein JKY37_30310, partial [Nannocystaceae bacterium]|nr:hypothetical protein [Nannocystaceae bacterium]